MKWIIAKTWGAGRERAYQLGLTGGDYRIITCRREAEGCRMREEDLIFAQPLFIDPMLMETIRCNVLKTEYRS